MTPATKADNGLENNHADKPDGGRLTILEFEILDREVDDRGIFLHVEVVLGEAGEVEDQVPAAGSKGRDPHLNDLRGCCGSIPAPEKLAMKDDGAVDEY